MTHTAPASAHVVISMYIHIYAPEQDKEGTV